MTTATTAARRRARANDPVFGYSADECARVLGVGRTTIYKLLSENKLASVKIGRRRVILRSSALALVGEGK